MDDQYYIRVLGRVQGPYTIDKLQAMAARGRFARHYHVSTDRCTWTPASDYPELFPAAAPLPTPAASDPPPPRESQTSGQREFDLERDSSADPAATGRRQGALPGAEPEWFYTHNGRELGPVTISQLRMLAAVRALEPDDFVWSEGMEEWVEASQLADVFAPAAVGDGGPAASTQAYFPRKTSGMAVASFVLGLLGATFFFFLGSILAVVFGHVALNQIRENESTMGGRGMAIAGLILGYIVIITGSAVLLIALCLLVLQIALG